MTRSLRSERHKELLQLLRQARKAAGLTQKQLGAFIERSQPFISKIETGQRRLDVVEFLELVEAMGARPHESIDDLQKVPA